MLLALHGFTELDTSWDELLGSAAAGSLSRVPHRSALMPGHGWLPCPASTTPASVAAHLAAQLPADASTDVLGYSMGGRVALQLALNHPDRVRRLVLLSCSAGSLNEHDRAERAARDEALAQMLETDGIGTFVAWWESNPALKTYTPLPRSQVEALRSIRLNQDPLGLAMALRRLGQSVELGPWQRLGELRMPVLLLAGEHDQRYVGLMQRMQQAIPHAICETLPGCGHAAHREAPAALCGALRRFLNTAP